MVVELRKSSPTALVCNLIFSDAIDIGAFRDGPKEQSLQGPGDKDRTTVLYFRWSGLVTRDA